jgi:cell division protein FtsB
MISHYQRIRLSRPQIAAGVLGVLAAVGQAHAVTTEELAQKIEALEKQNAALQAKVSKLEAAQTAESSQVKQQAQVVEQMQHSAESGAAPSAAEESSTTVSSYGEIGYTHPTKEPAVSNVSVGRAVIFVGHRFDEATKMVGEFEWENAITSGQDSGEAEVEQLYVEHDFKIGVSGTAGLYLMPAGLINQNHEPTAYYGVFRPDVDTMIIPSTWREVGVGLSGHTDLGLTWDFGVTTDQNLSKWDPASDEGRVRGPLQAIHQEGQFATARDFAVHAALNWRGPGTLLGASVFTGKIGQQQPDFLGNNSRLLLWEVHGRYEVAGLDLAAEYARGTISNTDALNTLFLTNGTNNPTLVPSLFYGGYVQAAYRVWTDGYFKLIPFARYEILNTAAEFGNLGVAETGQVQPDEKEWTLGASFFFGEGVVLKADYRHYAQNQLPSAIPFGFNKGTSYNVGVGYSF